MYLAASNHRTPCIVHVFNCSALTRARGAEWDNAKKLVEARAFGGKETPVYAAAVIGDTVGDPLKDTAGPSLHILIKLENILSITLLPLFITYAIFQ